MLAAAPCEHCRHSSSIGSSSASLIQRTVVRNDNSCSQIRCTLPSPPAGSHRTRHLRRRTRIENAFATAGQQFRTWWRPSTTTSEAGLERGMPRRAATNRDCEVGLAVWTAPTPRGLKLGANNSKRQAPKGPEGDQAVFAHNVKAPAHLYTLCDSSCLSLLPGRSG